MYENYKSRMSRRGAYMGEIMRNQSEHVVEATWMNSVSTYPVMVHSIMSGLPPAYVSAEEYVDPIYAHFETKAVYTPGGNEPSYFVTFPPHMMQENVTIKVGSYVSIPDVDGVPSYWLIIHRDYDNELIKCQVIRCSWTLKWVANNVIYQTLCVIRNGAAENIGVETIGQLNSVDSDMFVWCPTNDDTRTIGYDTRFLISDAERMPPLAWKVSRIRDVEPTGFTRLSLTQDLYNQNTDDAGLMLANYNADAIGMTESNKISQTFSVTYNGTRPTIKIGSSKTFTAQLTEDNQFDIVWNVVDGETTYSSDSYDNTTIIYGDYTLITTDCTMQLKIGQNYDLVGKILTIRANCANGDIGEISVEVVS